MSPALSLLLALTSPAAADPADVFLPGPGQVVHLPDLQPGDLEPLSGWLRDRAGERVLHPDGRVVIDPAPDVPLVAAHGRVLLKGEGQSDGLAIYRHDGTELLAHGTHFPYDPGREGFGPEHGVWTVSAQPHDASWKDGRARRSAYERIDPLADRRAGKALLLGLDAQRRRHLAAIDVERPIDGA